MKRLELLKAAPLGLLAACSRSAGGLLVPQPQALRGRSMPGHWQWTNPDGSVWKVEQDYKDPSKMNTYYTNPKGNGGFVGMLHSHVNALGFGEYQIVVDNSDSCETPNYCQVTPPDPYCSWEIIFETDNEKWGPGKIIKLFTDHLGKDYFWHVFADTTGSPGGILKLADGTKLIKWTGDMNSKTATHISYPWNYTVTYSYDPGSMGPNLSSDCNWKLVGFVGACIGAGVLVWTAETGIGALAAAGAIAAAAKEGHDFSTCK
jgi:hypothetical protein